MCWARGIRRRLSRNGSYIRWIPVGGKEERREIIYRRKCAGCRRSFSLLPQDVLPGHRHSLELVAAGLWRGLNGDSARSRSFFEEELGIRQPPDDPTSWTDFLDSLDPPPRPEPSRLQGWMRWADRRALAWLGPLAVACLDAGCQLRSDLRDVMQPLAGATVCSAALALVLGLFAWLRGAQPDMDLVKVLLPVLSRPYRRTSHETPRAATTGSGYDVTCLDLRAPPAWVRAIPTGGIR